MIRNYEIYFSLGGDLTTWNIISSSPQKALRKVGGNVVGVAAPGYKIVVDEEYAANIARQLEEVEKKELFGD